MIEIIVAAIGGVVAITVALLRRDVKEVHKLVNSRSAEQSARIDQLAQMIVKSGYELPPDPAANKD